MNRVLVRKLFIEKTKLRRKESLSRGPLSIYSLSLVAQLNQAQRPKFPREQIPLAVRPHYVRARQVTIDTRYQILELDARTRYYRLVQYSRDITPPLEKSLSLSGQVVQNYYLDYYSPPFRPPKLIPSRLVSLVGLVIINQLSSSLIAYRESILGQRPDTS